MKKVLFVVMAIATIAFAGCDMDDENQRKITNLTGQTWYDTYIWFQADAEPGSTISGFEQKGTIGVGESCIVSTSDNYFHVSFDNAFGDMEMSKILPFSGSSTTVKADNLY